MNNLLDSIEKSRTTTLDRIFVGLGIPNVGKKTGRLISNLVFSVISSGAIAESRYLAHESGKDFSTSSYRTPVEMTETIFRLTEEDLLEVKDIGPETARAFVEYVEENSSVIERLLHELDLQIPETRFLPSQE